MKQLRLTFFLLFSFISGYSIPPIDFAEKEKISRTLAVDYPSTSAESLASSTHSLNSNTIAKLDNDAIEFKGKALQYASLGQIDKSLTNIEKYLYLEFNTSIFTNDGFDGIRDSDSFQALQQKYEPSFSIWTFIYLYVALIGFYISIIINFNKKIDVLAKVLISSFIFIHSFFIFHICLNITNYQYEYPHTYLMSTVFSFLYGPLLYFYFKRITQKYVPKKRDLMHLLPTALFLIYIVPIYTLSTSEKLDLMLERVTSGLNPGDSNQMAIIVVAKLVSLITYGYFIHKIYIESKKNKELSKENYRWQKYIYRIHISYVITYAIYGILISNHILSGFLYHTQVILMASMVLYVGYSANAQPNVFSGLYSLDNRLFFKYEKSGLTESLSHELSENLIRLFNDEKIFKESDINLESLAKRLDTTRHNASQVINEHFHMNFHELVNKYRINEAKAILQTDIQNNLNIIDIAYEVGYNNKVTFNKAFKKETKLTPSEFQKISTRVSV